MQTSLKVATNVRRAGVQARPRETPTFTKESRKKKPMKETEEEQKRRVRLKCDI